MKLEVDTMNENRSKILRIRGEMIKTAREEKGMEQKELAYRLGYSDASTLNKIEKGLQGMPADRLALLCKILDIPYSSMVGDMVMQLEDGRTVVIERQINLPKKQMLINRITALLERADDIQLDIIYTFIKGYIKEANDGNTDLEREGRQMDPQSH